MKDDYLFDPSSKDSGDAPQAREVRKLEQALAPFAFQARELELPVAEAEASDPITQESVSTQGTSERRLSWPRYAAAMALLIGAASWLLLNDNAAQPYAIANLRGQPTIDGQAAEGFTSELLAGRRIDCDSASQLELRVGRIGRVTLEPGSSLRLEEPRGAGAQYQLFLESGEIAASIFAAPRLFQVGTPSGMAVDLGCVYRARVEDDGSTWLSVETGQVAFETEQRRVVVPAGAGVRAQPGRGPGTPHWNDSSEELRAALEQIDSIEFDSGGAGPQTAVSLPEATQTQHSPAFDVALALILQGSEKRDTLIFWNLIGHQDSRVRNASAQRLAQLAPPPRGVELSACLSGDQASLEQWKQSLPWSW